MTAALAVQITLTEINCGACGGTYAISERYRLHREQKAGFWHCPYCQTTWGYAKGDLQRTQEELAAERTRHQGTIARLNERTAELEKAEKAAKRIRKRVQAGLCTCCNRTFQNLARHMASKHADAA
jgi:phage/plasmid primase-like uncharacterized protein